MPFGCPGVLTGAIDPLLALKSSSVCGVLLRKLRGNLAYLSRVGPVSGASIFEPLWHPANARSTICYNQWEGGTSMALTLHKCPRCGQRYYHGTSHRCPQPPPPPAAPPVPRNPAALDGLFLALSILLVVIGTVLIAALAPFLVPAVLFWTGVNGVVGAAIGSFRGRVIYGVAWGILLGPLGWLVVFLASDVRRHCPWCRLAVPRDALVCGHCTRPLP